MSDAVFFIVVTIGPIRDKIEAVCDFYHDEDDKVACNIKNREKNRIGVSLPDTLSSKRVERR